MLELIGRGYVIEHCVSTLNAMRKEDNYRVYVTEVLRGISKSVGCEVKLGYADFLEKSKRRVERAEERTAEDIISAIKAKAELINNGSDEFSGESHT